MIGFDLDAAERISKATRRVERGFPNFPRRVPQIHEVSGHITFCRITSTPTLIDGLYYNCNVLTYDLVSKTFTPHDQGLALPLNNGPLDSLTFHLAKLMGIRAADGKAVFGVNDVRTPTIVRTTSSSQTGGVFPGKTQSINAATLAITDSQDCWILDINGFTSIANNRRFVGYIVGKRPDQKPLVAIENNGVTQTIPLVVGCVSGVLQAKDLQFASGHLISVSAAYNL